ncbi:type II toxin-antitoxin system HicB family antitoxin [Bacillus cereus]|nr:type II toxin-antitoxin system HicB family antitoxin [Bacillus cereus]
MNELSLQVLFEEDNAEGDVTAYIPALRLGVRGDTLDEARENARDLIAMELEQGRKIPRDTAIIETIRFSVTV